MTVGYGFKGALARYLPGGANDDAFDANRLYTMFVINDNAPWVGWWGVVVAASACAWIALVRWRLPIVLGVLSALALLLPVAILLGVSAAAMAGVTGPVWLVIASG